MTEHSNTAPTALPPGPLPDEQLPPYSGDDTVCAKCGFVGASTRYRGAGERGALESKPRRLSTTGERLERECVRCGYAWDEAVAPLHTVGGTCGREPCPDHPTRYRKGCLECAMAIPGEPSAAGTNQQPRHSSHTDPGALREPAGDQRDAEGPERPPDGRTDDLVLVGWYCWRCRNLNAAPCRSDCVPVHVPTEWATDMERELEQRESGDPD